MHVQIFKGNGQRMGFMETAQGLHGGIDPATIGEPGRIGGHIEFRPFRRPQVAHAIQLVRVFTACNVVSTSSGDVSRLGARRTYLTA